VNSSPLLHNRKLKTEIFPHMHDLKYNYKYECEYVAGCMFFARTKPNRNTSPSHTHTRTRTRTRTRTHAHTRTRARTHVSSEYRNCEALDRHCVTNRGASLLWSPDPSTGAQRPPIGESEGRRGAGVGGGRKRESGHAREKGWDGDEMWGTYELRVCTSARHPAPMP